MLPWGQFRRRDSNVSRAAVPTTQATPQLNRLGEPVARQILHSNAHADSAVQLFGREARVDDLLSSRLTAPDYLTCY